MPLSFKLKAPIFFLCSAVLITGCDTSTPEERQAKRIADCQHLISTTEPMPTAHLPLTERGKEIEFNSKWERCRSMVEDTQLPGEFERFPKDFNFDKYTYTKLGGKYIKIPKSMETGQGIVVPYDWKYAYIEYDLDTQAYELKTPDYRNGVYFLMHSVNNLAYQSAVSRAYNYDEACEKSRTDPSAPHSTFIWNDILFGSLTRIEHKGDNQIKWKKEWQRLCPIAVEAVTNNLEIFELQPEATVIPPKK